MSKRENRDRTVVRGDQYMNNTRKQYDSREQEFLNVPGKNRDNGNERQAEQNEEQYEQKSGKQRKNGKQSHDEYKDRDESEDDDYGEEQRSHGRSNKRFKKFFKGGNGRN